MEKSSYFDLQAEVCCKAGEEALEEVVDLGLLITQEGGDPLSEDDDQLYSFQHKLFHELTAAFYVAHELEEGANISTFFSNWQKAYNNREVLGFIGEMISEKIWGGIRASIASYLSQVYTVAVFEQTDRSNSVMRLQEQFGQLRECMLPYFGRKEKRKKNFFSEVNSTFSSEICDHPFRHWVFMTCVHRSNENGEVDKYLNVSSATVDTLKGCLSIYDGITHIHLYDLLQENGQSGGILQDRQLNMRQNIKVVRFSTSADFYELSDRGVTSFDAVANLLLCQNSLQRLEISGDIESRHFICFQTIPDQFTENIAGYTKLTSVKLDIVYLKFPQYKALIDCAVEKTNPGLVLELRNINVTADEFTKSIVATLNPKVLKHTENLSTKIEYLDPESDYMRYCLTCVILPNPTKQILHLGNVKLRDEAKQITSALNKGCLDKLEELIVDSCEMTASTIADIAMLVELRRSIKFVSADDNAFGELSCQIPDHEGSLLYAIGKAEHVKLYPNTATFESDINTLSSETLCPELKCMELQKPTNYSKADKDRGQSMYDECIQHLVNAMDDHKLNHIEELDVSNIPCSQSQMQNLLGSLHNCSNLKIFRATENNLHESLDILARNKHESLQELQVDHCNLVAEDLDAIVNGIENNNFQQLKSINLRFNNILDDYVTTTTKKCGGSVAFYSFNPGNLTNENKDQQIRRQVFEEIVDFDVRDLRSRGHLEARNALFQHLWNIAGIDIGS